MLKLTEELRSILAKPQGKLYEGTGTEPISKALSDFDHSLLACVGDVVTYYTLKITKPDVVVLDGRSIRKSLDKEIVNEIESETRDYDVLEAENPAGHITEDLVEKIILAIDRVMSGRRVRVFVRGEEDLAVMPLAIVLPKGSLIVYGQPKRGVVAVEVNEDRKYGMFELLNRMEKSGKTLEKLGRWLNGRFG